MAFKTAFLVISWKVILLYLFSGILRKCFKYQEIASPSLSGSEAK